MNKTLVCLTVAALTLLQVHAQEKKYSLEEIISMAKAESPSSKQAETLKENRYWQFRSYKADYNPRLNLSGNVPSYNRDFLPNRLDDGTISYQARQQMNPNLRLSLFQPIALTGGSLYVNSNLNQFNDLNRDIVNWNSTLVSIYLDQPIFAYNDLKWRKQIDPLLYEESKRSYVEDMEQVSRRAVDLYFAVLDAQISLQIATFNLANNDTIYKIEEGRFNIGTTTKDKLLQAELTLLRSRQEVTAAKIDLQSAKLRLRSYIGLRSDQEFDLALPEEIPELALSVDEALAQAKSNRAAFVAFKRRSLETKAEVAQAKGQRFSVDLTGSYGLNSSGITFDEAYMNPINQQVINLGVSIPLMDWGRSKARIQTALANQRLNDYIIAQDEVDFEQEVITQVRQFEVLYSQLEITKKSDEVAQERYLVSHNRYLIGKIDITNLNIALTEKDQAKRSYITALQSFWDAYYDLRRLTLYDFETQQPLYHPVE